MPISTLPPEDLFEDSSSWMPGVCRLATVRLRTCRTLCPRRCLQVLKHASNHAHSCIIKMVGTRLSVYRVPKTWEGTGEQLKMVHVRQT